mmetsp:Transcript_2514/g.6333  ORF Transcript_2514/g.6333 Transcript_2514/m.6333 type:complete len:225 (+) Transcript_2514:859-1533(+)
MVAILAVLETVVPAKLIPSSAAAYRSKHLSNAMTGRTSSKLFSLPSSFGFFDSVTSSRLSASSSLTGSGNMLCRFRKYFTLACAPLSCNFSSMANSNILTVDFPASKRVPSEVRSTRASCSRKYCTNSAASCCRPEENSGWFLPINALNMCGAIRHCRLSSSSSPSCKGVAYLAVFNALVSLATWPTRSSGGACDACARICSPSSQYLRFTSGNPSISCRVEFM